MIRRLARALINSKWHLSSLVLLDGLWLPKPLKPSDKPNQRTLVLAPPSAKNLGDQAMAFAVARYSDWGSLLLVGEPDEIIYKHMGLDTVVVQNLFSLNPFSRFSAKRKFIHLLKGFEEFVVIGADTLDGLYSAYESVRRISMVSLAVRLGIRTRIVGFSWPDNPNFHAAEAIRGLAPDTLFVPRDVVSFARFKDQISPLFLHQGADLAFSLGDFKSVTSSDWIRLQRSGGRKILGLNLNGHQNRNFNFFETYVHIIDFALNAGWSIGLLSHDSRSGVSDLDLAQALVSMFPAKPVRLLQKGEYFFETRDICSQMDLVITGRMHIGILSMSVQTPAAIVESGAIGKVSGLLEMLSLEELRIEANGQLYEAATRVLSTFEDMSPLWKVKLREGIPQMVKLSFENYKNLS